MRRDLEAGRLLAAREKFVMLAEIHREELRASYESLGELESEVADCVEAYRESSELLARAYDGYVESLDSEAHVELSDQLWIEASRTHDAGVARTADGDTCLGELELYEVP